MWGVSQQSQLHTKTTGEGVASTYAGLRAAILTLLTGPSCAAIAVPLCVVWSCLMRPPLEARLSGGVGPSSSIQLRSYWPAAQWTPWTLGPSTSVPQAMPSSNAWLGLVARRAGSTVECVFRRPDIAAAARPRQSVPRLSPTPDHLHHQDPLSRHGQNPFKGFFLAQSLWLHSSAADCSCRQQAARPQLPA